MRETALYNPTEVTLDNPDVQRLCARLDSGARLDSSSTKCPVCGKPNYIGRVTCQRAYCLEVWKVVKGIRRQKAKLQVGPASPALLQPCRAATPEEWLRRNPLITCERMSARLSPAACGTNWACFEPCRCRNVPKHCHPIERIDHER
ncbi:hypothetical protein [Bilophila wadsworthia]|uniref:hypothetical protein n=1 Tax=Bilophila wadsworthia TaxID=35833 RepID=UPI003038A34D